MLKRIALAFLLLGTVLATGGISLAPTAALAVLTAVVVSVAPVQAAEPTDPIADVGIINIIGVRANATSPFYIKGADSCASRTRFL